jgi:hypothetical protein
VNNPPFAITSARRWVEADGYSEESNILATAIGKCGQCSTFLHDQIWIGAPRNFIPTPKPWAALYTHHWKWMMAGAILLNARHGGEASGLIDIQFSLDELTTLNLHVEFQKPGNFSLTGPSNERTVTDAGDTLWQGLTYDPGDYRIELSQSIAGPENQVGNLWFFALFPMLPIECDCEDEP